MGVSWDVRGAMMEYGIIGRELNHRAHRIHREGRERKTRFTSQIKFLR
jgi:hypothetical protein